MHIKGNFYPEGFYTGKELLPVVGNILEYYEQISLLDIPTLIKIKAICYKRKKDEEEFVLYTIYYNEDGSISLNDRKISFAECCDLQKLWS